MELRVTRGSVADMTGSGYGSGSGYGYGYGDGSGSGDGYGYGSGYGYGYGDGSGYWKQILAPYQETRSGVVAFWRSDAGGRPANGGHGTRAEVGLVETSDGPLQLCQPGTLHGTFDPGKWKGERLWVVEYLGEVRYEDDKVGALSRRFLAEIKW